MKLEDFMAKYQLTDYPDKEGFTIRQITSNGEEVIVQTNSKDIALKLLEIPQRGQVSLFEALSKEALFQKRTFSIVDGTRTRLISIAEKEEKRIVLHIS